jgi:hypothetical protein
MKDHQCCLGLKARTLKRTLTSTKKLFQIDFRYLVFRLSTSTIDCSGRCETPAGQVGK